MIETMTYGQIKKNLYTYELLKRIIIIIAIIQLILFYELTKYLGFNIILNGFLITTIVLFMCSFIIETYMKEITSE